MGTAVAARIASRAVMWRSVGWFAWIFTTFRSTTTCSSTTRRYPAAIPAGGRFGPASLNPWPGHFWFWAPWIRQDASTIHRAGTGRSMNRGVLSNTEVRDPPSGASNPVKDVHGTPCPAAFLKDICWCGAKPGNQPGSNPAITRDQTLQSAGAKPCNQPGLNLAISRDQTLQLAVFKPCN